MKFNKEKISNINNNKNSQNEKEQGKSKNKDGNDVVYLQPKENIRMSTIGNIDPFARKTIAMPRETLRSGSPIATHNVNRSIYGTTKENLPHDFLKSSSNPNLLSQQDSQEYDKNIRKTATGVNPNFNNTNILSYMQPYNENTYQTGIAFDPRYSLYNQNSSNNYQQNTFFQPRAKNPQDTFTMDPYNYTQGPYANNSMQMMGQTHDPNKNVMNTYDSMIPMDNTYKVDTYKPGNNLNMSNYKDVRSPDDNELQEDQVDEKSFYNPEARKTKLLEIQYMKNYTDKEIEMMRSGVRMLTEESNKEYDDVEKLYQNYGKHIDAIVKDDETIIFRSRAVSRMFDASKLEGRLFNREAKVIAPAKWEDNLQSREKVMKKFTKISSYIKSKSQDPNKKKSNSYGDDEFDQIKQNLRDSKSAEPKGKIMTTHAPHLKFIRLTLAMLTSKGHNCEDRLITRDMRFEKGGVVDLAHKKERNDKIKIKKIDGYRSPQGRDRYRYSNRDREKAVKIVQAWWRDLLGKYKSLLYKIIKLQSTWRSYWFKLNMIDIIYATQMFNTFKNKVENVMDNNDKQYALDLLRDNYAYKFSARLYLVKLLRVQKNVKNWLSIQKDKRKFLNNLFEKLILKKRLETFNDIKDYADKEGKKRRDNINHLLLKTKKCARVAVFHDMLFSIFNRPINILKGKLFRNTLKNNMLKYHLLFKREYFMRWLKKCIGKGEYKKLAGDYMYKALVRPPFRSACRAMRALPPKDLKDRVLRGILKNYDKDSKHLLGYYFNLWKGITSKLRNEEFVMQLNTKLCMKTARKLQDNKLRQKFRFWRDSVKSKKDLRPFVNGLNGLNNFVNKAVAKQCLDPIRNATKGVQARTAKALLLSNKFHLLPLRHYYNKWKDVVQKQKDMENSVHFLLAMKNKGLGKLLDKILLRRLWDWRRKTNLAKLHDLMSKDDTKERKYYALVKLMNGTEKLAKRKALQTTLPPIYAWLTDLIRQRAVKDILFMFPKLNRIALRNYWRKWNKQNDKLRQKEVRNGFFASLSDKAGSKLRLKILRKNLLRWWRNLPKNMELNYYRGADLMKNAINRSHLAKPVEAIKQKILLENAKNGMQHAFGLKDKFIRRHWRQYFMRWYKIAENLKSKEAEQNLCSKIIFNFSDNYKRRVLAKWWSHWKKTPKINLNDVYTKFKNGADLVKKTVHKALEPARSHFFNKIKDSVSKPFMRKVVEKLMGMATNGNEIKLRHYLWKWHVQCKNIEILDLKKRLMRSNVNNNKERIKRNELYHAFSLWKTRVGENKVRDASNHNLRLYEAISHINKVKFMRENDFWIRMKRLMNLDHRGILMNNIRKKLLKPRTDLAFALYRWRKFKDDEVSAEQQTEKMARLLRNGTNKFKDRLNRDNFIRCFHLWAGKAKTPSDYYQRIIDGKNKVNNYLKSKLSKPYNNIINNKNYSKLFKSCLPANCRLSQRDKHDNLLRLWNVWKNYMHQKRLQEHKALLIGKLSDKHLAVRDMNSKGKYFRFWAGIKPKTLQFPEVVKAVNIIDEVLKKPHRKPILEALQDKKEKVVKKKALRSGVRRKKNNSDLLLKAYLWTWRTKARKLLDQEFKNRVIANNCKNLANKNKKNDLYRAFFKWISGKEKHIPVYDYRPTRLAMEILKKTFEKKPFQELKEKTKMMNLKIPNGMSLSHALIRLNPNVCKSMALRNIAIRKNWNLWRAFVKREQVNETRDKVFSKILNISGINIGKTALRRYLRLWKSKVDQENLKNEKEAAVARWAKSVYANNLKLWQRRCLRLWKANLDKYIRDLANISEGVRKLNARVKRPHFRDFCKYGHFDPTKCSKLELAKKMLLNTLRNNDKGNLLFAFSLWKHKKNQMREADLKYRLLKQLGTRTDKYSSDYWNNRLHEKFLKWRIIANPRNQLQNLHKVRDGAKKLNIGLLKKYNNDIIPRLKKQAKGDTTREALYKLLSKYDDKFNLEYLRIKFKWWRIRVGDTEKMKNELKDLANRYVVSPIGHKNLVENPKNDLVDAMKTWHELKTDKAKDIQSYCKSLLLILQKMKNMKRIKLLHQKLAKLSVDDFLNFKAKFNLWRTNAQLLKNNESATKIQNFTKTKLADIKKKREIMNQAGDHMSQFLKLYAFNNIWLQSKENRRRQLLVKLMKDIPEELKQEYLKKYFLKWWKVMRNAKEEEAANIINNKARAFRSSKKKKKLVDQKDRVEKLLKNLFIKHSDKLQGGLMLWRSNVQKEIYNEKATLIQKFTKPTYQKLIKENARDDIYRLIKKKYIKELHQAMKAASKISGDRGQIMYDTLHNMYIRLPFDKLKLASKWIGIIGKMRDVCPKVHTALRKRFLPPKLRLWHANTVGLKNDVLNKYNNWIKEKDDKNNKDGLRSRNKFFEKHFQKLDKQFELKKKITLKLWNKKAKILKFSDNAEKIQAVRRGGLVRTRYSQEINRQKVRDLTRILFLRNFISELKNTCGYVAPLRQNLHDTTRDLENRYAINNLSSIANNDFRNKILETLTGKKIFSADRIALRFWFNKWRVNGSKIDESALKLQTKFRSRKAKKKAQRIRSVNDILAKKVLHYSLSDENKTKIALRLWSSKAQLIKIDEDGQKIRNFCRVALDKNRIKNFQKNFANWAVKLGKKRISNGIKVDNLKWNLRKFCLRGFIPRLVNYDKCEKFKNVFLSRFGLMSDELKKLYMKKYYRLWRLNAEKKKNKEQDSAIKIQTKFRSSNTKKNVDKLRKKHKRVYMMLMKLCTRMIIKQQVALRLWNGKIKEEDANKDASKIQKFCRDGQQKLRSKKKSDKEKKFDNFVKITMKNIDRAEERPVYDKIKSEANRNILTKAVDDLQEVKDDHIKTAFNNIKNYGDMKWAAFRDKAKKIQDAWKNTKWRRHIKDLVDKIQRLRAILKLVADRDLRFKYKALRLWKKNSIIPELENSAKIIQTFCREKILIPRYQKKPLMQQKTKDLLKKNLINFHLLPFLKQLTNTIKLDQFQLKIRAYAFKKFRYNVDNRDKMLTMRKLFRLPQSISNKILRNRLKLWKINAEKIKQDEAAKKIQRNLRSSNKKRKNKRTSDLLNKQLSFLHLRHDNLKKFYLLWWASQATKIKQNESATIIQKFTRTEWERIKVKKNWFRLGDSLKKRDAIDNGLAILNKYKIFRKIDPLVRNWDLKLKRTGFDGLKEKGRLRKMGNLLKSMFGNFENRDDVLRLFHWWKIWRQNNSKLNQRDIQLDKMVKAINDRDHIERTRSVADACTVKRLGKLVDTIRAKDAMKNLKWRAANKKHIEDLGKTLTKGRDDLAKKNKDVVKDKLLQLYVYKVIDNMNKQINKIDQHKLKPQFAKHFVNQLKNNYLAGSKDQYNHSNKALRSGNPKKLKFNKNTIDAKNADNSYDAEKLAVPAGTKVLSNLFNKKRKEVFDQINKDNKNKDCLSNKDKLRKMFRMSFIQKLKEALVEPAKMVKQRYLIRLAFMHKNCNDKRTFRELIRKWRFQVMMNRFLKKKSENIYKQMHMNYINIVQNLMGDSTADGYGNGSLYNEVELLGKNMGLYKNLDPNTLYENQLEETKHDKSVKFYKFFGLDYKPKQVVEEENSHVIDEENPDINADLQSNVYGRYGEDTIKSINSKLNK